MVLIKLILAHFAGDFLFQPKSWVLEKETKKARSPRLYLHFLLHGLLSLILLWDFSIWPLYVSIIVIHGMIDILKIYFQKPNRKITWLLTDQFLHLASLTALYGYWFRPDVQPLLEFFQQPVFWLYLLAFLFNTAVAGVVIQTLMYKWTDAIKKYDEDKDASTSLKSAGKYIGILERLLVFTFIVTGHWEGIGFLLAAKSIFRFGDLKESRDIKLTEYILIGTLLSFAMAVASAMLVKALIPYF